jgi:hypothetical protein
VNYRASIVLGALLALGVAACDPYEDEKGGTPTVVGVTLTEGHVPSNAEPPAAGAAWSVTGEDSAQNVVFVAANKSLDGASIQTSPADCTPAGGWLTATGPAITCEAGTPTWYTCYQPASPTPEQGGSIAIFQSCDPISTDGGWFDVAELAPSSTYTFTGTVQDRGGNPLEINVTVNTAAAPPPATP